MTGYTKLFGSLLFSTVWGLSKEARILWITMLVMKDRKQVVTASIPGLANAARLTIPETERGLQELSKPDPYSQSQEEAGRRIRQISNNEWHIVNGSKYRDLMSAEDRREYKAQHEAQRRAKKKGRVPKEDQPLGRPLKGEVAAVQGFENGTLDKDFQPTHGVGHE